MTSTSIKTSMRIPPYPPRRAFTLIEVLVVLAVIGLLVALVLPAFATPLAGLLDLGCQPP